MKNIMIFTISLILLIACSADITSDNIQSVTFDTSLKCEDCVTKMFDNLPHEKGVVDLEVSYEEKLVTIVFNKSETSVDELADKINEMGYSAFVKDLKSVPGNK